jgi:hypothetical protein
MLALIRNAHTIDKDQSSVPRLTALVPKPQVTTKAVYPTLPPCPLVLYAAVVKRCAWQDEDACVYQERKHQRKRRAQRTMIDGAGTKTA